MDMREKRGGREKKAEDKEREIEFPTSPILL